MSFKLDNSELKLGSFGSDVSELQTLLNKNGFDLTVNGIYDSHTAQAVSDYKLKNKIDVNGTVGKSTWAALRGEPISSGTTTPTTTTKYSWQDQLNDTINKILNREEFSYDLDGDALYQQYKDKATQQGKMASADVMGQAVAMTGGYGNSYAQTVGNQAYRASLENLNDIIPELYQMAYDKYNQEGQDLYNKYSVLAGQTEFEEATRQFDEQMDFSKQQYADKNEASDASPVVGGGTGGTSRITDAMRKKAASFTNNIDLQRYVAGLEASGQISTDEKFALLNEYIDDNEKYTKDEHGNSTTTLSYRDMVENSAGWSVVDDGGINWFWGVDNNAIVTSPTGEQIRLDNLVDKLVAEGMSKSDAKNAVKKLQENLNIVS
jgi:peptidoglycan hydrolase-like protein with peptidoglycan-binding domain